MKFEMSANMACSSDNEISKSRKIEHIIERIISLCRFRSKWVK